MKIKNILRQQADDFDFGGGAGTAVLDPAPAQATPAAPAAGTPPAPPATPVNQPPAGPAPVQLTPEQLKELVTGLAPKQEPKAPAPVQMSQEEQDKLLRRFKPDSAFVTKLFAVEATPEQRAQALQDLVDRTAEHAFHTAQLQMQRELSRLREEFGKEFEPVRNYYTKQQEEAAVKSFYSKHPYFENYKQVVGMVASAFPKEQVQKMTAEQFEQAVVAGTLHNLKSLGFSVDPNQQQQAQPTTPRSPALNGGGRSQGTSIPAGGASKQADEAAWLDS